MKITFLCSDPAHPVNSYILNWMQDNNQLHEITLARCKEDLHGGDILFLISCLEVINLDKRNLFKTSLVLHASDLPKGKGWSPYVWEIINGAETITLSLLEAEDKVDSGRIWKKLNIHIPKHYLFDQINALLFDAEIELIDYAVNNFYIVQPQPQSSEIESTYYRRRNPNDSQIDPYLSIYEQFDLIRISDPNRYPVFFKMHGQSFKLIIERFDEKQDYN